MAFPRLLFLFVMVPLVELSILIKLGKYLGTLNTILIIILTGILGAAFARSQGAGIISRIKTSLNQGQVPGDELIQGLLILAGGLMLITPGFITDLLGFSLILPQSRKLFAGWLLAYMKNKLHSGRWQVNDSRFYSPDDTNGDDSDDRPEIKQ